MAGPCCDIFEKFGGARARYHVGDHWVVQVRPQQATLGASVLIARRHALSLGGLSEGELVDFGRAVTELERRLQAAFQYDKINYLLLMMVDPHLHFHVIPRYAKTRSFAGIEWPDPGWPKRPDLERAVAAPGAAEAVMRALAPAGRGE
jgi:diadenosine tetraphosphate (Ap4A) HIT family hydrolase